MIWITVIIFVDFSPLADHVHRSITDADDHHHLLATGTDTLEGNVTELVLIVVVHSLAFTSIITALIACRI